jgi:hypothetical protein
MRAPASAGAVRRRGGRAAAAPPSREKGKREGEANAARAGCQADSRHFHGSDTVVEDPSRETGRSGCSAAADPVRIGSARVGQDSDPDGDVSGSES